MELRTRVQLHALAMELTKRPGSASGAAETLSPQTAVGTTPSGDRDLSDSQLRRLLLRKMRQQNAVDLVR